MEKDIPTIPQWFKRAEAHTLPLAPHKTTEETMRALEDSLGSDAASDTLAGKTQEERTKIRKQRKKQRARTGSH